MDPDRRLLSRNFSEFFIHFHTTTSEMKKYSKFRAMARILLLLLVWILRHTLGDIEQRFEQSDFRGEMGWGVLIYTRGAGYFPNPPRVYDIEMVDTICTGTCLFTMLGFVVFFIELFLHLLMIFKMTKK